MLYDGPWIASKRLRDRDVFTYVGGLKEHFATQTYLRIDFGRVAWADPLSLLAIVTAIGTYRKDAVVEIDLGRIDACSPGHRSFLRFIDTQGFLDILQVVSTLYYTDASAGRAVVDDQARLTISAITEPLNLPNQDCIRAVILRASDFVLRPDALASRIEKFIEEARTRAIDSVFGANAYLRDQAFQKLRKTLFELTSNAVEHAYDDGKGYVGIYCRVRCQRPTSPLDGKRWNDLHRVERAEAPGIKQFPLNPGADWLELFICDAGCGLFAHAGEWSISGDPSLARKIRIGAKARRPLHSLGPVLFRYPVSRRDRDARERTSVTGLMDIGQILALDGDYCRIYTAGSWLGGLHPWDPEQSGSQETAFRVNKTPALGTAFVIAIQPKLQGTIYPEGEWVALTPQAREHLTDVLSSPTLPNLERWKVFDLREPAAALPRSPDPPELQVVSDRETVVLLRPPRWALKRDLAPWIAAMLGNIRSPPVWAAETFIIGDLTAFQARHFAEFFKSIFVFGDSVRITQGFEKKRLVLVSETWHVCVLEQTLDLPNRLVVVPQSSKRFSDDKETRGGITQYALALRYADSIAFWTIKPDDMTKPVYYRGKVVWQETADSTPFTIEGFLDMPQALADGVRYRACERALRRTLALFPNLDPLPTDDLLGSLIDDAERPLRDSRPKHASDGGRLAVGSICVTARTLMRHSDRMDVNVKALVTLFMHGSATILESFTPVRGLLWSPLGEQTAPSAEGFQRIPGTPYIAQGGERHVSIVRFRSKAAQPFASPYYQSPFQTYRELTRYGALRIGHWAYGSRHDLFGFNITQAFDLAADENGDLIRWLARTFRHLFADGGPKSPQAAILVYPSHPTTDRIIAFVKDDSRFAGILPKFGVFPVKFLGSRTISPFLVSPLAAEQIRSAIVKSKTVRPVTVILDNATLSGKHYREISQLLVSLGSGPVHTVVILDRTGLPVNEEVMDAFQARHHRFYRIDVPPLGHQRECPLCAALSRAQDRKSQAGLASLRSRIDAWQELWKPRSISRNWHDSSVFPIAFDRPVDVTFGVGVDSAGDVTRNVLPISDSTGLACVACELGRLTTKSSVAVSKALQIAGLHRTKNPGVARPDAALEILCAQMLLFFDELTYWEKRERFVLIMTLLWTVEPESQRTALGALCMLLAEGPLAEDVWRAFISQELTANDAPTTDASLAALHLWASKGDSRTGANHTLVGNVEQLTKRNRLLLGITPIYRDSLLSVFSILGYQAGPAHARGVDEVLEPLLKWDMDDNQGAARLFRVVYANLERLEQSLLHLEKAACFIEGTLADGFMDDAANLGHLLRDAPSDGIAGEVSNANRNNIINWAADVRIFLYGSDERDGLFAKYRSLLMGEIIKGKPQSILLEKLISTFIDRRWNRIIGRVSTASLRKRWTGIGTPRIRSTGGKWTEEGMVIFDPLVREAILDTLSNVIHSSERLEYLEGGTLERVDLLWQGRIDAGNLLLEFFNLTDQGAPTLKLTPALAGVERIGGAWAVRRTRRPTDPVNEPRGKELICVTIKLPMLATLIGRS